MNATNIKIKSYAWQSWAKGLFIGLFLGMGIEAVILIWLI